MISKWCSIAPNQQKWPSYTKHTTLATVLFLVCSQFYLFTRQRFIKHLPWARYCLLVFSNILWTRTCMAQPPWSLALPTETHPSRKDGTVHMWEWPAALLEHTVRADRKEFHHRDRQQLTESLPSMCPAPKCFKDTGSPYCLKIECSYEAFHKP